MARTKKTNTAAASRKTHPGTGHTCGECARGAYDEKHENRTTDGRPFLKICEFSHYSTNAAGQNVCFISTAACPNFTELTNN